MNNYNIILDTDSYKHSHYAQYPADTSMVNSYIESRGGEYKKTVFFGLQAWLKKALKNPITMDNINEAAMICAAHGVPFNKDGWLYILDKHNGYLPLEIEAIPEGSVIGTRNVLVQVRNTDPACFWLTSFIETAMLRAIWYPTTVATVSYHIKQVILKYLQKTSDEKPEDIIDFMLHDFGSRGVSSEESAGIGGLAHLVNFKGTDTMAALLTARKYYNADMAGFSVPATEHSTMTSWLKSGEADAYRNMIEVFGKNGGIVSIVSDSYDIFNACEKIFGEELKELVDHQAEKFGTRLVVRPDSGDPVEIVEKVISSLMKKFGHKKNDKGYKVLPNHVRVLQGDGINANSLEAILDNLAKKKISTENVVFGMGGGLLQQLDRDTLKFAMKCSAITVSGKDRDVFKDPVTDPGKTSKKGVLSIVRNPKDGTLKTIRRDQLKSAPDDHLKVVYKNGNILIDEDFELIRERAA